MAQSGHTAQIGSHGTKWVTRHKTGTKLDYQSPHCDPGHGFRIQMKTLSKTVPTFTFDNAIKQHEVTYHTI